MKVIIVKEVMTCGVSPVAMLFWESSSVPAQLICKTPGRSFALALSRTSCLEDIIYIYDQVDGDQRGVTEEH